METAKAVDAFILFNESEDSVVQIVEQLESRGVETFFWRRDIPLGAKWDDIEQDQLDKAIVILTFLGERGWGPTHEKLAEKARSTGKRILPVLIGNPPDGALDHVGRLFHELRYADLREPNDQALTTLANTIHRLASEQPDAETSQQVDVNPAVFDRFIDMLVNGSDDQRSDVLASIRTVGGSQRQLFSARLRSEITERFHPGRSDYSPAVRDPARSWLLSALIALDPNEEKNRELILRHLDPSYETDRIVRFWVVAGLGQARAHQREVMSRSLNDPEREVKYLAMAFQNAGDSVISEFRRDLRSENFDIAWPVLRVLRVVAIPPLAPDVLRILGRPSEAKWYYDAIHALALPEMASAAAKEPLHSLTLEGLVRLVVEALRGAGTKTAEAFAQFLNAFDQRPVDNAIAVLRSDNILSDTATRLARALSTVRVGPGGQRELSMAGYCNDLVDDRVGPKFDRLDITMDVRTLTAVMLSTDVQPPLAIGLFGDWGSGKSFFMKSMQVEVVRLASETKTAKKTNFCTEPVQIEFNAWHYADTNLWASIVDYILEQLAAKVQPTLSPEEQQAKLLAELGSTKSIVTQATNEKKAIETLIDEKKGKVEEFRAARENKEIKLRDLKAKHFKDALEKVDKKGLDAALKELGVPEAVSSVQELAQVVAETNSVRGQLVATFHTILNQKNPAVFWTLLVVALFGVPVATWALNKAADIPLVNAATAAAAEIGALITAVVAAMRKGLSEVQKHLATVEQARAEIDKQLKEEQQVLTKEETDLRAEIAGLASQEQEATNRLSAAAARVLELEEKIKVLEAGRSLGQFLTERRQSQDYQKHLGLISTIRKDFQGLADRLKAAANSNDPKQRVDRIILYIDDLDRCPPDKVLEVLQAVHLLLAFPLFVVVVGVDPRWLRNSLARNYSALLSDVDVDGGRRENGSHEDKNGDEKHGVERRADSRATPQNYLEKIFQVPFTLHQMSEAGYGKLVESLLTPAATDTLDASKTPASGTTPAGTGTSTMGGSQAGAGSTTQPSSGSGTTAGQSQTTTTQTGGGAQAGQGQSAQQGSTFVISDEALVIQLWEARFASRLYPLIPTPRAAKRLTNVYRILKACVPRNELKTFEGSDVVAGTFQLPMLLLAMIVKAPTECAQVFPLLLRQAGAGANALESLQRLDTLASGVDPDETQLAELAEAIRPIVSDVSFRAANDEFVKWIPKVSRYSFEIGGILREKAKPAAVPKAQLLPSRKRKRARQSTNGRSKKA